MRNNAFMLIFLCCAALLIAACGKKAPDDKKTDTAPADQTKEVAAQTKEVKQEIIQEWGETKIFRGFATFGHEVRTFQPCGSSMVLWVSDHSGQFWELHYDIVPHSETSAQVFTIVEARQGPPPDDGFGSDYSGTLLIEEVIYMTHEGLGCKTYWNSFQFRALGHEPSWSAEATDRELRLTRLGESDQTWTGITKSNFANGVKYLSGETGDTIELVITKIPCRDTMSGAYYGYNAALKLRAETFRGCAIPGIDPTSQDE